ncbi:30S ribosomal protein S13 [Haliscomenobacter hydrossis]|uniref:Small ribosomal subunit protein uS13 n=1 Tax=Haliscomenobacter hydrossis (strain ATCC 27775 / DSM 1100 / LMG 10767 / O) TaxID=760192 RepID=F4KXU0_HALH1|nr:30S ribosomal protein S13 [Haliscomenobacter hydrossis]AEE52599.1 30S ribosomal protein S13 [Haliscomenobacter hydrossis DSM 1100]
MARIAGIDLPRHKRGVIALTYIFGVGSTTARKVLAEADVSEDVKVEAWTDDNIREISRIVTSQYKTEGELKTEVTMSIKRLQDIACYRGLRHRKGLPLRGQRTRTNARTRKGPRKTVANKKKATK